MKRYIAAMTVAVLLSACQQENAQTADKADKKESKEQKTLIADKDKIAYAVGVNMAESIVQINKQYKAVEMDAEVVKQGFMAKLEGNAALSDEEVGQQLQIFQQKMREAQQQKMQEDQAKKQEELEAKKGENAAYFAKLDETGEYQKTESGLYYKVLQEAKPGAKKPSETDSVKVSYAGTFTDGKEFDSNKEFHFSLRGGVIQGWLEGVKLMPVGSKYQFVIPPELGYGNTQRGPIPAGSILLFDVELLEIIDPEEKPAKEEKQAEK